MPTEQDPAQANVTRTTVYPVLVALFASHLTNDTLQALLPSLYPLFKQSFSLSFTQIGLITLTFQLTASILQPLVGAYTDRHPKPYSLAFGMVLTLAGLAALSRAPNYMAIILSAMLIGMGSSIFHPEASRVAHMAAGVQYGFAQSIFQTGGNLGSALGPPLAALVVVSHGQHSILWFTLLAFAGVLLLARVGRWYKSHLGQFRKKSAAHTDPGLPRKKVILALAVLIALIFSKYFYLVSLTNYYTFFLIQKFGVSIQHSLYLLFAFLAAIAAGTMIGGPLGDRFGRKYVIWVSILGVAPFTLVLPHVGLAATVVLTVVIGLILASAFSAILVYAQELVPGRVGMISGLFFGLAFGFAGIASAALGFLADKTSIGFVFEVCGYLPLIGLLTWFLPNIEGAGRRHRRLAAQEAA